MNNSLIFCFILFFACSQTEEMNIDRTIQFEGKLYKLNSEDPFTGIIYNNYSNGQREFQGHYVKGVPNGKLIYFFDNGLKMREGDLKNGVPKGRWTYYNIDGSIKKIEDN